MPLVLRHTIQTDSPHQLEAELHGRFDACRLHGEWFHAIPELAEVAHATVDETPIPLRTRRSYVRSQDKVVDQWAGYVHPTAEEMEETMQRIFAGMPPDGDLLALLDEHDAALAA